MAKIFLGILILAFLSSTFSPLPLAQADEFHLPVPGVIVHLSPEFNSAILKGIKVNPDNPFRFEFILDKGDSELNNDQLKNESSKLIKYFLASLTIPEKDLWVNLSPYEKDRVIPQSFGLTEMGRDLLAEDYMLKQITASLIYPEDEIGKKFWKRIYEEARKKFGTTNIPVNTFNKVWIVPAKAVVYENVKAGTAYVVESKLKVMLEQDYLALEKNTVILSAAKGLNKINSLRDSSSTTQNDVNALGSQIVREIVIPELAKEVNEDKNFAKLRQVYNSLILAAWYKKKIKDSILAQVYADKKKIAGVGYDQSMLPSEVGAAQRNEHNDVELIYQRYLQAFKKGAYNYIKEDIDPITQEAIPRKYFSGGESFSDNAMAAATTVLEEFPRIGGQVGQLIVDASIAQSPPAGWLSTVSPETMFDPRGQRYQGWYPDIRNLFKKRAEQITGWVALSSGRSSGLSAYLTVTNNPEERSKRVEAKVNEAMRLKKKIIIEVAPGNTANTVALAEKNKDALVLGIGIYRNDETTQEYRQESLDFNSERLLVDQKRREGLNNAEVIKGNLDFIRYLDNASVDSIVYVMPEYQCLGDFIVMAREFGLVQKMKKEGHVYIMTPQRNKVFSNLVRNYFKVDNPLPIDTEVLGVNLSEKSLYARHQVFLDRTSILRLSLIKQAQMIVRGDSAPLAKDVAMNASLNNLAVTPSEALQRGFTELMHGLGLLEEGAVKGSPQDNHPVLAITGIQGAGKTTMADEFREFLEQQGHPAVVIHTDRFLSSRKLKIETLIHDPFILPKYVLDYQKRREYLRSIYLNHSSIDEFWNQMQSVLSGDELSELNVPGQGIVEIKPNTTFIFEGVWLEDMFPSLGPTKTAMIDLSSKMQGERVRQRFINRGEKSLYVYLYWKVFWQKFSSEEINRNLDKYDYLIKFDHNNMVSVEPRDGAQLGGQESMGSKDLAMVAGLHETANSMSQELFKALEETGDELGMEESFPDLERKYNARFIGSGGSSGYAFKIRISNRDVVIKFFERSGQVDLEQEGMKLALGEPLFQQYLAHSSGVNNQLDWIASDFVNGEHFETDYIDGWPNLRFEEKQRHWLSLKERINAVPQAHWDQLIQIFATALKKGIRIDFSSDNFLYDKNRGFVVIDYAKQTRSVLSLYDQLIKQDLAAYIVLGFFPDQWGDENRDLIRHIIEVRLAAGVGKVENEKDSDNATGGIDLTPSKMNLQTKVIDSRFRGNGNEGGENGSVGIKFHLDPAMLEELQNAPGFVPVIINIQPLEDLRRFLGVDVLDS